MQLIAVNYDNNDDNPSCVTFEMIQIEKAK